MSEDLLSVVIEALRAAHKSRIYREGGALAGDIQKVNSAFRSAMQDVLDQHILATVKLGKLIELLSESPKTEQEPEAVVKSLMSLLREGRVANATDDST